MRRRIIVPRERSLTPRVSSATGRTPSATWKASALMTAKGSVLALNKVHSKQNTNFHRPDFTACFITVIHSPNVIDRACLCLSFKRQFWVLSLTADRVGFYEEQLTLP